MSNWGWFLGTPPWEKKTEKLKQIKRHEEDSGPQELTSAKIPFWQQQIIAAMTGTEAKRSRGCPEKGVSLDLQRALIVEGHIRDAKQQGFSMSRRRAIADLQRHQLNRKSDDGHALLFPHRDLEQSVCRGFKELQELRAIFEGNSSTKLAK